MGAGLDYPQPTSEVSCMKKDHRSGSFLANNRVVFNIKGNAFGLVAVIQYEFGIVYIRFVGAHREYDRIDVTTV